MKKAKQHQNQKITGRPRVNREAGFSVLELTVAIFLISVILTAVAANMARASRALWEAKSRFYAVNMAQNCIEEFNYANKKFNWRNFYNNRYGTAGNLISSELCLMPIPTAARMTYLCCGDDCGRATGWSGTGFDSINRGWDVFGNGSVACEAVPLLGELQTKDPVLGTEKGVVWNGENAVGLTNGWITERRFFDVDSNTIFSFRIRMANGNAPYERSYFDTATGQFRDETGQRQMVVVVIDVSWEKFNARADDRNHFSVTRQYLGIH